MVMSVEPPTPLRAGLADALAAYPQGERASFHMPGHKQHPPSPAAIAALGADIWRHDVSEMGGFDYLHSPTDAIATAQAGAAATFGAGRTFFLVGGSTIGNLAAFVAHAHDGDHVAVLRGSHRSVYAGIVLSGAVPHYLAMRHHEPSDGWYLPEPPNAADLPDRLAIVHVTRPNYYGMAVDLAPYRALADATGAVLVVDEAHGSHFGFHPGFPASALAQGADIVIQSTHKTLRALTQASMLHVREGFDASSLERALPMLQSSSPSALLSVSLDLARAELDANRTGLFQQLCAHIDAARAGIAPLHGFTLVRESPDDRATLDPAKLVIDVSAKGWSGFAASAWLRENTRLWVELADFRRIVCSLTFGDNDDSVAFLIDSLTKLHAATPPSEKPPALAALPIPPQVLAPRAALASPIRTVAVDEATDEICAEYVIPYPPGIPLVVPGERITAAVLDALNAFRTAGSKVVGPADQSGATLRVTAG